MNDENGLRRTHPATVAVRSVTAFGQAALFLIFFSCTGLSSGNVLQVIGVAGLVVLLTTLITGASWLNWRYFLYGVVGTDLVISQGWLIKKHRAIPVARVQGVDIRANIVQRAFGLADVVIQTAGGGATEPEARIGSIPLGEAEQLRARILHKEVAETPAAPTVAAPSFGPDPLGRMSDTRGVFAGAEAGRVESSYEYRVPLVRLVIAGLTSQAIVVSLFALLALGGQLMEVADLVSGDAVTNAATAFQRAALPVAIALTVTGVLIAAAIAVASTVARDFGFVVRRAGDRLETEAGLLERRMTSMPVSRIQAVRIEQSALKRLLGFAVIKADTAGFGRGEEQPRASASAVVPIARRSEVRPLLHSLLEEAEDFPAVTRVPRRALRFYLLWPTASALALGAVTVVAAYALTPIAGGIAAGLAVTATVAVAVARGLSWRSAGIGADSAAVAVHKGVIGSYLVRIPRSRIQSLSVRQTLFQRRAGLATVDITTVSGSRGIRHVVGSIEVADARALARWYSPDTATASA